MIQHNRFDSDAKANMIAKGKKCIFALINKVVNHNLNFHTAMHIFDHAAAPIILYGSEIWNMPDLTSKKLSKFNDYQRIEEGFRDCAIERLQLQYLKSVLGVGKSTVTEAVYGETGRYPLYIKCFKQMINFWIHVKGANEKSLVFLAGQDNFKLANENKTCWGLGLKRILDYFGQSRAWECGLPVTCTDKSYPFYFERAVRTNYDVFWQHKINKGLHEGGKLALYAKFKSNNSEEKYLSLPFWQRKYISKLRMSNHKLFIETGRYGKERLDRDMRICKYCTLGVPEDEQHFLLDCPYYRLERYDFLRIIARFINIDTLSKEEITTEILKCQNNELASAVGKFARLACDRNDKVVGWVEHPRLG